jgi:hypothetical protein
MEKRKYIRYAIHDGTLAIIDTNIGCVVDISQDGLAIKYFIDKSLPAETKANLLNKLTNLSISELPLKIIRRGKTEISPFGNMKTQTIGFKFNHPDVDQQKQIRQFISMLS